MNNLMSQGYEPMGGISTHMNTHTRPVLGIDSQEYTQTMVMYENFEVWVKETDAERLAQSDEQRSEFLQTQLKNIETGMAKDIKRIKELKELLANSEETSAQARKSIFRKFTQAVKDSQRQNRMNLLRKSQESLAAHKKHHDEMTKEYSEINGRLTQFYKSNPSITRDILLNSR